MRLDISLSFFVPEYAPEWHRRRYLFGPVWFAKSIHRISKRLAKHNNFWMRFRVPGKICYVRTPDVRRIFCPIHPIQTSKTEPWPPRAVLSAADILCAYALRR